MPKGAASKEAIMKKILEVFPGAFLYNDGKEIRIPMIESGETIQIKCALTCAKVNVEMGSDNAIPSAFPPPANATKTVVTPTEPSKEEKKAVSDLLTQLGL